MPCTLCRPVKPSSVLMSQSLQPWSDLLENTTAWLAKLLIGSKRWTQQDFHGDAKCMSTGQYLKSRKDEWEC